MAESYHGPYASFTLDELEYIAYVISQERLEPSPLARSMTGFPESILEKIQRVRDSDPTFRQPHK